MDYRNTGMSLVDYRNTRMSLVDYRNTRMSLVDYRNSRTSLVDYRNTRRSLVDYRNSRMSLVDYRNTRTPSVQCRLGSVTVAAGFPQRKQPIFPMGEIPMGEYSCKINNNKSYAISIAVHCVNFEIWCKP